MRIASYPGTRISTSALSGALALLSLALGTGLVSAQSATVTIRLTGASTGPISAGLYGLNYDWNKVPATTPNPSAPNPTYAAFPAYASFLGQIGATLSRYPGGWNAEHFNWTTNSEPTWGQAPLGFTTGDPAGTDPTTFIRGVPAACFTTPSKPAVGAAPADLAAAVAQLTQESVDLVRQYGGRVKVWEIGNEWWLQGDAAVNAATRTQNRSHYAQLVQSVVPAMKAADPSISVYVMGEWTTAGTSDDDFAVLRSLVGASAWQAVDGISIHSYVGTDPSQASSLYTALPSQVASIRATTGKTDVFSSEWAMTRDRTSATGESFGIANANVLLLAFQELALSGVKLATYWPSVTQEVPAIALSSRDFTSTQFDGALFSWMAHHYQGQALETTGSLPSVAARRSDGTVTIFIPTRSAGRVEIDLDLKGTGLTVVSSQTEVLYANDPATDQTPLLAPLPTKQTGETVSLVLNPGTAGRGSSFEIARVTLQADHMTSTPPQSAILSENNSLVSQNGNYQLVMQSDGNLVLSSSGTALWSSQTSVPGGAASYLALQSDGNLVVYRTSDSKAVWNSGTEGQGPGTLVVQDDGNVVIYRSSDGQAVWSTGTER